MREVADRRGHGTTGEPPILRFAREEAGALRPLAGRPPFRQVRELARRVQADALRRARHQRLQRAPAQALAAPASQSDRQSRWRLIGAWVTVQVGDGLVRIHHAGEGVARHAERRGRRERAVDPARLAGIVARLSDRQRMMPAAAAPAPETLIRPLVEYERAVGDGW